MIKFIKRLFSPIHKWDAFCILVLIFATLITRIVIIYDTPFVYAQDAYIYLNSAKNFAYAGTIELRTGMPFIIILGLSISLLRPFFDAFFVSRLLMLVGSVMMILILYKIGKKMLGRQLGLFAGLLAIFEPNCIKYSTVPYLEVFAISTGLLALYFIFSSQKLQKFLSIFFFYLAVLTRPELYIPLAVPLFFVYLYKNCNVHSKQFTHILPPFLFAFCVYILPSFIMSFYVNSWGAFGVFQRIELFLTPDLLLSTTYSVFHFYDQQFLNYLLCLFILIIISFSIFKTSFYVGFRPSGTKLNFSIKSKLSKSLIFSNDCRLTAFCLFLLSILYILVLTLFAYSYTWAFYVSPVDMSNIDILREAVIISSSLHDRYLIFLRLLLSYPLAYPLTLLTEKVWMRFVRQN